MLGVSGTVDPDEILTLGLVLPQVETSQFVYTLSVCHIQTHQQKPDGMNWTRIAYADRNTAAEGSVLFALCCAFFFVYPSWERARLMLNGDGSILNSSHRNIAISSTYRPGFWVR